MTEKKSPALFCRRAFQIILAAFSLGIFLLAVFSFAIPLFFAFIQRGNGGSSLQTSALLKIATFTLVQAFCSTALAVALGIPAAAFVTHRDFPLKRALLASAAVPLCIPPLIVALGYVGFFGMNGVVNRAFSAIIGTDKKISGFLYSFWGIVIAQGFYNFPLVMLSVSDSWASLSSAQSDAAKMLGAGRIRIFFSITIFQLLSAIVSAIIPVFLYCFFSFLIVMLFGGIGTTTLEVELYQVARNSLDFSAASKIALLETALALSVIALYSAIEIKQKTTAKKTEAGNAPKRRKIKGAEKIIAFFFFLLILIFFVSPLLCIVFSAFPNGSLSAIKKIASKKGFFTAAIQTVKTGALTSVFSVATALLCATFLRLKRHENLFLKALPMLPMAVSSVVMGFGMTAAVRTGTPFALVASQTALTWPLAFRQIWAGFSKISNETIDAAILLSPHKIDAVFSVLLPESRRSIISSLALCFAVSAGDTTLPLVLAIPSFDTLSLFTYRLAGSYRFSEACASALILGAWCSILFAFANKMKETK